MKFLCVSNFIFNPDSGSGGTITAIAETLQKKGHEVDTLWQTQSPFRLLRFGLSELFELPGRQFLQVSGQLKKKPYDVVLISQPFAYKVFEKMVRQYPKTLFVNRTHGWEERVYQASRRWREKESAFRSWLSRMRAFMNRRACLRTVRACQGLIVPSRHCANYILNAGENSDEKLVVIPHGLPHEIFDRPAAHRPVEICKKMLYVGNYLPIKGSKVMEQLLPAIALDRPEAEMTFVVPPESVQKIRQIYEPIFGPRLTVHSWMHREELLKIYATHGILLFPSLFEGFCKAVLEAMALGMCVVGFDEGGLPDIATSGKHALFCDTGNIEEFRKLLGGALASPERVLEIGKNAMQASRRYSWDKSIENTVAFCVQRRKDLGME